MLKFQPNLLGDETALGGRGWHKNNANMTKIVVESMTIVGVRVQRRHSFSSCWLYCSLAPLSKETGGKWTIFDTCWNCSLVSNRNLDGDKMLCLINATR